MPTKSIYFPDELWEQIEQELDEGDNLSEVVQESVRRELEGEFEELEELTKGVEDLRSEVEELKNWRHGVMEDVTDWFTSEFRPSE